MLARVAAHRAWPVFWRILVAVGGGYGLCALAVAVAGAALAALGMARSEAVVLSAMLGFVGYAVFLVWAFAVRSVWRLVIWAGAAGAVLGTTLWALAR